ncbi:hypothetical protein [Lysinibacillus sp. Bpr_S20]|uniref:hypothetical protein n=1 Tax=Lysinibacillus sp. Bpr_S20 TaxID=2933964 RepID=UPI00201247B4|nr:hypothetical protein [Lysinibacillus sp. Bpr_S20]MCL1702981.1 hypothetical protein [Lysinibacillus sp. Bpr_S20]
MYLKICGPLNKLEGKYQAEFHPDQYKTSPSSIHVPLFIILEGLAQIGCRASSIELFNNKSTFPIQFNNLVYHSSNYIDVVSNNRKNLLLHAEVKKKGQIGIAYCSLLSKQNELIISMNIWTTLREENGNNSLYKE